MYPDKNIKEYADCIIPSICFFGRCLGFYPQKSYVEQVGFSLFPKTTEDFILVSLIQDMNRAYSGCPQTLTSDAVISKVGALIPWNTFQREYELKQCAACVLPLQDDLRPYTALQALENSRFINNHYQPAFMVILTIEVLARLVKHCDGVRSELEEFSRIIFNYNYWDAARYIEVRVNDIKSPEQMQQDIVHSIETSLQKQISEVSNA